MPTHNFHGVVRVTAEAFEHDETCWTEIRIVEDDGHRQPVNIPLTLYFRGANRPMAKVLADAINSANGSPVAQTALDELLAQRARQVMASRSLP